ncbi:unnamed protein product, partial [marine sediment metagenome]
MKIRAIDLLITAAILIALPGENAFALECPLPQTGTVAGTLPQSAQDITETGTRLAHGTAGNAVNEIVFELKRKYPDASTEEIVNYLITAYCPVVARKSGLSADQAA